MTARRRSPTLLAAALVLAGIAAMALAALRPGEPRPRAVGGDRPVNAGAGDLGDIRAHNSPTVARNPRRPSNLAVSSRIDTPRFSCALHVSFDGGRRWSPTAVPIPPGEERKCYAPDVAFAADGTLHMSYVTLRGVGNVPNAVWVASSRDGGRTLAAPRRIAGRRAFQVRLAVDPADPRRLHVAWLQAEALGPLRFAAPGNPIVTASSEDGGATWTRPVRVSDPARGRVLAPVPAVGPRGRLHVLYLDVGGDALDYEGGHDALGGPPYAGRFSLVLARSEDGTSWAESVVDDQVAPIARFVAFLPPFPSLAIDGREGRIHVAYHDARDGSADVRVWTLEPGAGRWSDGVRVNDTPRRDRTTQHLPRLAVAPDGRLDVVYYDRRADPRDVRTEVSLQSSGDGGRSFGPRVQLSERPFDSRIGAGSERGLPDLGSRIGLVSGEREALAVWTDTRAGTDASNKQDLHAAVAVVARERGDGALRWIGLALALAGVAVLLWRGRRSTA